MSPVRKQAHRLDIESVRRLWFHRQGLARPRGRRLTRKAFGEHLESTGGLQLDSVNALARAHTLTLWSRFGKYAPATVDDRVYKERLAYDFIGHEACLIPPSRLPLSRRYMREFDPQGIWWQGRRVPLSMRRHVLKRIRDEGPLESAQFKNERSPKGGWWDWKVEKMALEWLMRKGRLAVSERRSFRRVYDLAERVYPSGPTASRREYEDSWLLLGLAANGVAPERHLAGYLSPRLKAATRRQVIARNLKQGRIIEVEVPGLDGPCFALPEMLAGIGRLPAARGTNLLCPFDSLLWQRLRAEELLGFHYRIEIYVPAPKRRYGYYVLPILHEGRLVGRLDPKLDRSAGRLIIHAIHLEPGFAAGADFRAGLAESLRDLGDWLGAQVLDLPRGWRRLA